jgi:hypothetical protein
MTLKINDVFTWGWPLSKPMIRASQNVYTSPKDAILALGNAKRSLVKKFPLGSQTRLEITTLFNFKINEIKKEQRSERKSDQAESKYLTLAQLACNQEVVSTLKKVGISFPKAITSENYFLLRDLIESKREEFLKEKIDTWYDHALEAATIDLCPNAWIVKLQEEFFAKPEIKATLDKLTIPLEAQLTPEGLRQFINSLTLRAKQDETARTLKCAYDLFIYPLQHFKHPAAIEGTKTWEEIASHKISGLEKRLKEVNLDWPKDIEKIFENYHLKNWLYFLNLKIPYPLNREEFLKFIYELLAKAKTNTDIQPFLSVLYWHVMEHLDIAAITDQTLISVIENPEIKGRLERAGVQVPQLTLQNISQFRDGLELKAKQFLSLQPILKSIKEKFLEQSLDRLSESLPSFTGSA